MALVLPLSCARMYLALGVLKENIVMLDSKGVIQRREELSSEKAEFATNRRINSLEDAIKNADVFLGLSMGNIMSKAMVKSMAKDPLFLHLQILNLRYVTKMPSMHEMM